MTPCPFAPARVHRGASGSPSFFTDFLNPSAFSMRILHPQRIFKNIYATPLKFWKITPAVPQQYSSIEVQQYSSTATPQQYKWLFTGTPVRFSFFLTLGCTPVEKVTPTGAVRQGVSRINIWAKKLYFFPHPVWKYTYFFPVERQRKMTKVTKSDLIWCEALKILNI